MFHMPMSSPMMTTMLGFLSCAQAVRGQPDRQASSTAASEDAYSFGFAMKVHLSLTPSDFVGALSVAGCC